MNATHEDTDLLALVDVTRRRLAVIREQSPQSPGDRFAQHLIEGVYGFILGLTITLWAVLGFVVWVPLLVRYTSVLAGTVFYGTLLRDQLRVANARARVHFAAGFYRRGFDHFLAFYRQRREPEAPVGLIEPLTAMTRPALLLEGAWIASVWSVIVLGFLRLFT